jgi:hypothetical protein
LSRVISGGLAATRDDEAKHANADSVTFQARCAGCHAQQ